MGGVAALTVCEFLAIVGCLLYYYKKYPLERAPSSKQYVDVATSSLENIFPNANNLLFSWRIFCFLWFFCFAIMGKWIYDAADTGKDPGYWYFTNWNLILLGIYFLVTLLCTLQYRIDSRGGADNDVVSPTLPSWWGPTARSRLVQLCGVMHDVAGANAIFVTVVALGILDPSPNFWNLTNHLSNTLFMFVELALNKLQARHDNYIWSISWAFVYVCFAWIIVYSGVRKTPYFFLKTVDEPGAFGWYTGLLMLNALFFWFWVWICRKSKELVHRQYDVKTTEGATLVELSAIELTNEVPVSQVDNPI